jgi:hypothetical protein
VRALTLLAATGGRAAQQLAEKAVLKNNGASLADSLQWLLDMASKLFLDVQQRAHVSDMATAWAVAAAEELATGVVPSAHERVIGNLIDFGMLNIARMLDRWTSGGRQGATSLCDLLEKLAKVRLSHALSLFQHEWPIIAGFASTMLALLDVCRPQNFDSARARTTRAPVH